MNIKEVARYLDIQKNMLSSNLAGVNYFWKTGNYNIKDTKVFLVFLKLENKIKEGVLKMKIFIGKFVVLLVVLWSSLALAANGDKFIFFIQHNRPIDAGIVSALEISLKKIPESECVTWEQAREPHWILPAKAPLIWF